MTFLLLSAVTAARVVRGPATATAGAGSLTPLPRLGRRAPTLAGLGFALRRPGGRAAVPVRVTALVAVFGIAGVVAVGTFAASLDRLVHTPARYGWVADFATVDAKPHDTAAIAADPRVTAVTVGDGGSVRIDGVVTTGRGAAPGQRPVTDPGAVRPAAATARRDRARPGRTWTGWAPRSATP